MMANDVATQQRKSPVVEFRHDLKRLHDAGELALPSTVGFDAFKNAAIVAVTDNQDILRCKKESVFKAIRTLAGAGLVPDGREAAIVPFKGSAQAMPMVYGLIKVARNSGAVKSLWADVIYDGETLEVWVEDGERKWNHVTEDGSRLDAMERGGNIRGAYAVAKLDDGTVEFQPMSLDEIEKRRKASANQKGDRPTGIWEKWYPEMAMKTVIRNMCKRLPMSAQDMNRIMTEQDPLLDVTPEKKESAFVARARAARGEEPEGETIDGTAEHAEDQNGTPAEDAPEEKESLKDMFEYDEGAFSRTEDKALSDCPYADDEDERKALAWRKGWLDKDNELGE